MTESIEDLEPLVTRCPHCSTRFRVSEAQLQVAKGRVRCGACLTVFLGIDHLQWDLEQDSVAVDPDQSIDKLLDEIDAFEVTGQPAGEEAPTGEPGEASVPEPDASELSELSELSGLNEPVSDAGFAADGLLVEEIFLELPEPEPEPEPEPMTALSEATSGSESLPYTGQPVSNLPTDIPGDPFARLSQEVSLEEEPEEDPFFGSTAVLAGAAVDAPGIFDEEVPPGAPSEEQSTERTVIAPEVLAELTSTAPSAANDDEPASPSSEDKPEVVPVPRTRRRSMRNLAIGGAVLLIAAQLVWYLLPSWIADPEKRWLPEKFCEVAGCKLKPLRDLRQLLLTNVVVRVHPERPEVRQIDLLLVNSAAFEQAFPDIEIAFRTPEGDQVAWKRFTPAQYLAGDMQGATAIPKKTPVRISLEVSDPGTISYAYEITLK